MAQLHTRPKTAINLISDKCLLMCFKQKKSLFNTKKLVDPVLCAIVQGLSVPQELYKHAIWKVQVQKMEYLSGGGGGGGCSRPVEKGLISDNHP